MNVFIVYAHHDPHSLNGYLKNVAVKQLERLGHTVIVSDLYQMGWKAIADRNDFKELSSDKYFSYMKESAIAYETDTQTDDIKGEQEKLLWADVIIFQFPFWWFSMPAILKGWIDRVYAFGFAYGTGKYGGKYWGDRYGEGTLQDKKAMLSITIGGREAQYSKRGINGYIEDLLFPIHHGMLWYPGIKVLPPHVIYQSHRVNQENIESFKMDYEKRLSKLEETPPIPFRYQNFGDYDEQQCLKPGLGELSSGFSIHLE